MGRPASSNEYSYWETHYRRGGSSGEGSVGDLREWKWRIINLYVKDADDIVDIGCGDLSFWDCELALKPVHYCGVDISPTIIARNQRTYPDRSFSIADARTPILALKGRIVLCLDVLFHILDDDTFLHILENLCRYSLEWIFVFTWCKNPFSLSFSFQWRLRQLYTKLVTSGSINWNLLWALISPRRIRANIRSLTCAINSDGLYQKYRVFENSLGVFEKNGFRLIGRHQSPYYKGDGAMYVFHADASSLLVTS